MNLASSNILITFEEQTQRDMENLDRLFAHIYKLTGDCSPFEITEIDKNTFEVNNVKTGNKFGTFEVYGNSIKKI